MHKRNAVTVKGQVKPRVYSTPKEPTASLKQCAQQYISMNCSLQRSREGCSDPHMHNNEPAKLQHVHRIAYVMKPLARDPSADITDREAVHQSTTHQVQRHSSPTSEAQCPFDGLEEKDRVGATRPTCITSYTHMHTIKITRSRPKRPTSKIERKE